MSYASIMVCVDPGPSASRRAGLAAQLARSFDARLIGIAGWEPDYPRGYGETVVPAGYGIEELRQKALGELTEAERVFRDAAGPGERIEWRSDLKNPGVYLEEQSRAADLVVLGRRGERELPHLLSAASPGDALMALGRPILVVPPGVGQFVADRIVVAWKDTLQTRRAISDAMPLLKRAGTVHVVEVTNDLDQAGLEDVVGYLKLHGVKAHSDQRPTSGMDVAELLLNFSEEVQTDLIVAGAYGYSRLREWFFGGVTRTLLNQSPVCCLMSH